MKFKVGQQVYFYQTTGDYQGDIVEGTITKAIKDLETNKVIYTIKTANDWLWYKTRELTSEYLYYSRKAIEKEYKEEIVYNNLAKKADNLQATLDKIYKELAKDEHKDFIGQTLTLSGLKNFNTACIGTADINIDGIGSVKEELTKLKKDINKIKKEIKPKTKKVVVKETKEI